MNCKVEVLFKEIDTAHPLYKYLCWEDDEVTIVTQENGYWCYAEDFFSVRKVVSFTVTESEEL